MADPTIGEVVEAYFKTEDEIKKIAEEAAAKIKPLEEFQIARKNFCGKLLTEQQGQNIKTAAGTAFFKKQEFVNVADWDAFVEKELIEPMVKAIMDIDDKDVRLTAKGFLSVLKDSFPYELLNKAVNKTAVLEIMGEEVQLKDEAGAVIGKGRPNVPPAGINYVSKQVVQIHRK